MPSERSNKLKEGLSAPPTAPAIQRGRGVQLSTTAQEESAETPERQNARTPEREIARESQRTSRGFAIRADLVKAMKRVALDEDRHLYEVLEEAVEQYLERRKG